MPRVLVFGATGYLGRRVADLLTRSGQHRVFGIARNDAKARDLAAVEVTPIVCSDPANEPAVYLDAIREHGIDVVVDVAGANQDSTKFLKDIKGLGEERLANNKVAGVPFAPKLGFIYCSGTWVHGTSERPVTDLNLPDNNGPTPPAPLVAWRVDLENSILAASDVLDVAIVRPALMYGRESTIWTPFFLPVVQAAREGSREPVKIPLEPDARPGLIHVDDAARGFQCVIEKLSQINAGSTYPVFDLVTSQESMANIFQAAATAWGAKGGFQLVGAGENAFAVAMSTTMRGSSDRAKQLLGWVPTRFNGLVADMDIYATAFASQH